MSLLPSATFANPSTPFYAANGGGGSASTLQSPATILPEVGTGTAQLTMNSTGAATSFLNMASAATSVIGVNGNVQSSVGFGNTPAVWLAKLQGDGLLRVGLNENGTAPVMSVDATNNIVNLGAPVAGGSVVANAPLTIQDQTYPATGVVISGEPPFLGVTGVSRISNDLVSNGVLQLGSSVAHPDTLELIETTGGGAYGYVTVGGQSGGTGDRLKFYGGGAACSITTDDAGVSGVLNIGADDTNPSYQSLAFTHNAVGVNVPMTFSAAAGVPKTTSAAIELASGVLGPGTIAISTGGLGQGLYAVYGRAIGSAAAGDLAARFSTIIEIVGTSCVAGGQVSGQTNTYILAPNNTGGLNLTIVAATTAAYQVIAFPLYRT